MKTLWRISVQTLCTQKKRAAFTIMGVTLSVIMLVLVCALALTLVDLQYNIELAERKARGNTDIDTLRAIILADSDYLVVQSIAILFAVIAAIGTTGSIYGVLMLNMGERSKVLAALTTMGATVSHGMALLMFDSLLISLFAIPLGIGAGLGMMYPMVSSIDRIAASLGEGEVLPVAFLHSQPWAFVLVMAALSFLTIWIASLRPASQLLKKAPVEMARTKDGINIRFKSSFFDRLISKLFGVTGRLAATNYVNHKHQYRRLSLPITTIALIYVLFALVIRYVSGNDRADRNDPHAKQFLFLLGIFMMILLAVALFSGFCQVFVSFQRRRGEFAMLASMGMTQGQLCRLVSLEAVYYGFYTLLYIVAGSLVGNAVLFSAFALWDSHTKLLDPWKEMGVAVIVVIFIAWLLSLIMTVVVKRINIVEALKA